MMASVIVAIKFTIGLEDYDHEYLPHVWPRCTLLLPFGLEFAGRMVVATVVAGVPG